MGTSLRLLCSLLLVFQTVTCSVVEAQQAATTVRTPFVLEDGTPVKLRLSQTVSSADAHVNDRVEFEVLDDVMVGDVVVIAKGGVALGTVTEAVPKRRMARGGKLEIVMDSVRLVDGQKAALRAVKEGKGGGHTGGMTVGIVAAAIVFWPAAPLFLLMHGKDISFPKGTDVPTFINGEMKLDPVKFQQAEGGSTQPIVTAAKSNLTINSTPIGADIYVDQNFVGNTPSTVNAPSGKHSVTVRKPGFQDWVREMTLSGGTITLTAELIPGSTVPTAAPQGQAQSVQNMSVSRPQPQTQLQGADVSTTPEVSVAEAARRNKAAKEAERPKDNPPPQQ
jgi:PEGA domain